MPTIDCTNKERFDVPFSAAVTVIIKDSRALVIDLCLYFNNGKHELCCILIHTETGSEGMSCNTISRKDVTAEEMLICWCSKTIPGSRTGSYVITIAEGELDCTASSPELFRRGGSPAPGRKGEPGGLGELPWPPLLSTSLPGTLRALHASRHKCQLIEFANDTFSQNPSH